MKNTYNGGDFVIEGVEVKGDDNKAAPELRLVVRRGADIAILGVIGAAADAFSGGGCDCGTWRFSKIRFLFFFLNIFS